MQHFISQYGYLAVFVLMLAESACLPLPSEVIMPFGGALASGALATGTHPSLAGIIIAGVVGSVIGSYVPWALGKYAGQAAVRRWGRRVGLGERHIVRATRWFERYGPVAVLVGRLLPVIRGPISLPAGFAAMPALRFGVYTAIGCIPWTAAFGVIGYELGGHWQAVDNAFHSPAYYIVAAAVVLALVAAVVIVALRRRSRIRTQDDKQDPS